MTSPAEQERALIVAESSPEREPMRLTGSKGSIDAKVGDRFRWWDGTEWEIVGFTADRIYSPSGFGGTPIVTLRCLGGDVDPITARFMDGELSDWCGDSVATGLINSLAHLQTRSER